MWHAASPHLAWLLLALPVLWWSMRGLSSALSPIRFLGIVMTRHAMFVLLVLSLAGIGWARMIPRDPVIIYLIDRSNSIDDHERLWQREQLLQLDATLADRAERVIMPFAAQAQVASRWRMDRPMLAGAVTSAQQSTPTMAYATNLQAAFLTALALSTDERPKRIVLLSDGVETTGQALQAANVSRLERTPLYSFIPPATSYEDVALTKLLVPQMARQQEPVSVRVRLDNASSQAKRARLVVRGNERPVFDERVELPPGKHLIDVSVRPLSVGSFRVDARVEVVGDQVTTNNVRAAAFEVIGPPRILVLSHDRSRVPYIAQVMASREVTVAVQDVSGFPPSIAQLTAYDAVVMANFPRTVLAPEQLQLLRDYVQEYGGGLVVIGAGGDLAREAQSVTPLDTILPARWTMDAPQERATQRRLSIILVVDRSNSMSGKRMELTKHGAVELIKQLDPSDLMGIVAFDEYPYTVIPLMPVGQARRHIIDRLIQISPGGGTNFLPALVGAKNMLLKSDAVVKHLILLSDGNTQNPYSPLYKVFTAEAKAHNVTVSTIAIGSAFVRRDLLQFIARQTRGHFYHIKHEEQIPQILVADTQRMLTRSPFAEGSYEPKIAESHDILGTIRETDLPTIKGYLMMEPKAQATTSITVTSDVQEQDPLLMHWQAGLGRVVMFASDADARWSRPWIESDQYQRFWRQVMSWAMRSASLQELATRVVLERDAPMLTVHVPLQEERVEQFRVQLVALDDTIPVADLPLTQITEHQWRAALDTVPPGTYHALFLQTAQGQLVGEARRWITIDAPTRGAVTESPAMPTNTELLTALAERTGGAVGADADTIIGTAPAQRVVQPWDVWFLPVFLLFFLIDVALRGETMV